MNKKVKSNMHRYAVVDDLSVTRRLYYSRRRKQLETQHWVSIAFARFVLFYSGHENVLSLHEAVISLKNSML